MTPRELRLAVPACSRWTWLNAAASSPLPNPVRLAMEAHLAEASEQGDLGFRRWVELKDRARSRVAQFIGAQERELSLTPSTSFGFHVMARMLLARGIREVLTLEGEFPSTTVPLLHAGLRLRGVRRRVDGTYPLEDIAAACRPSTGAVALSVVQFASGYRVDLPKVAALCRDRGLTLCLNAAQALGQVPIDVAALGASFLAAPSHKWLMAGYGQGLLYIASEWLEAVPLPLAGWLSVPAQDMWRPFAGAERAEDDAGFLAWGSSIRADASAAELGAGGWLGAVALNAALDLHSAVSLATTQAQVQKLQALLRRGLRQRGFQPNAPDEAPQSSGICVVPVQGDPEEVARRLVKERQIVTTARGGGLRVSTHVYNDEEDVVRLLAGFDALHISPPSG